MKILIVPDSFKGSASSMVVADAIEQGLSRSILEVKCHSVPMADGGEGSLEAVHANLGGEWVVAPTVDPLLRPIQAKYLQVGSTAYVELASASGLDHLNSSERNAGLTSTKGTGLLMANAVQKGVRNIVLFIGGSATNDGGAGIATALGFTFRDRDGEVFLPVGNTLHTVHTIEAPPHASEIKVTVLCDVRNPFTGPNGATYIYGPQKGATNRDLVHLEAGMVHFQKHLESWSGKNLNQIEGAGAAGGVGGGVCALFDASMQSGIEFFLERFDIEKQIIDADLIITGEGKLDQQSPQGKLISGVARLCQKHQKPIIALCGAVFLSAEETRSLGLTAAFSILSSVCDEFTAIKYVRQNIIDQTTQIANLIGTLKKTHE